MGGFFAFSYQYSDHNIAVPIVVHTIYDFSAIFFTWLIASRDLSKRIGEVESGIDISAFQPSQIDTAAGAVIN